MKQFFTLIISVLFLSSCHHHAPISYEGNESLKKEVLRSSRHIERVIKLGEKEHLLTHIDPSYLDTQLNDVLQGDTIKFLNEFFCGKINNKFACIKFDDIRKIDLISVSSKNAGSFTLTYHIENDTKTCITAELILKKIKHKYFLFSSEG